MVGDVNVSEHIIRVENVLVFQIKKMMIDALCRSISKLLLNSAAFYIFGLVFIYRKKKEWTLWHQQACLVMEMRTQN